MSLKRAFALAVAALAACNPTGNTNVTVPSADLRLGNFVVDATALTMASNGIVVHASLPFATVTLAKTIDLQDSVFVITQTSDAFPLGTDTLTLTDGRKYTYYALGKLSALKPRLVVDDTIPALAGTIKIRFIHGVGAQTLSALDFYFSKTTDSLANIVALAPSVSYGGQSAYAVADTAFHRLRVTQTGKTAVLLDTTFTTSFNDSTVVTMVLSDKVGGGPPIVATPVIDLAP